MKFTWFKLQLGYKSKRKRLSKQPKFYLFDPGVQKALANQLSLASSQGSSSFDRSFEHFIISQIIALADYARKDYKFSFYRASSGLEVDLIIESPSEGVMAIEIKAKDANLRKSDLRGLKSFKELVPEARLICCSLSPRARVEDEIGILPWQEDLKLILSEPT